MNKIILLTNNEGKVYEAMYKDTLQSVWVPEVYPKELGALYDENLNEWIMYE